MSPEEFTMEISRLHSLENEYRKHAEEVRAERKSKADTYAAAALSESPYSIGDPYRDENGRLFFVAGAYVSLIHPDGHVYLRFNFAKKDGSMSKVSAFGRGEPRVKIK